MILLMKKIIIMLTALLTISLSACSQNKKTLVAYFSASGTTKGIAQQLATGLAQQAVSFFRGDGRQVFSSCHHRQAAEYAGIRRGVCRFPYLVVYLPHYHQHLHGGV